MKKIISLIALLTVTSTVIHAAESHKSLPRKDLSNLSKDIITKFTPSFGDKEVVEYEPLVGHDGDCESTLPYNATASGTLSLSNVRYIGGESSLCWDYTKDDVMSFSFDENKSLAHPEYETRGGGAAFLYMWLYNTCAIAEKDLYVKIYDGKGALAFEFPIYLDFEGWRCLMITYDEMKPGYDEKEISRMEFYAPANEEGRLFFDAISPTLSCAGGFGNKDYLTPWRADGFNHWGLQWKWDSIKHPTPPQSISQEVREDLEVVYNRVIEEIMDEPLKREWNPSIVAKIKAEYEKYNIKVSADGEITGAMILLDSKYFDLMELIADNYLIAPQGSSDREELRELFLTMAWHMVDQGFAKGHGMGYYLHYGYRCNRVAPAMIKMKAELKERGLYKDMEQALIWLYGLNRIFDKRENLKKGNADDFHTLYRTYLTLVQIIDDENVRSLYMQTLSDYFNYAIDWRNDSALKENGAHYHHGVHYADYTSRALGALGEIGVKLHGTRYRFSEGAHETLRRCAMVGLHSSYPYRDLSLYPIGMVSRAREESPTAGYSAQLYSNLAIMGTPDGELEIDPEMASIYRYNFANAKEIDLGDDIQQIDLDGTWTLPHGRNMTHRRDNWSAMVTSMSNNGHRNIEAQGWKSTNGPNMSGIMQAFGRFEIYYHEETIAENGFHKNGYNWSHRDGITTPDIPANLNRMGPPSYGGIDANFANGAVKGGVGGVYGTILDNNPSASKAMFPGVFGVKKSWYFFDGVIVALGSNINYKYKPMEHIMYRVEDDEIFRDLPVVTTIFQKSIASKSNPGTHNGATIAEGVERVASRGGDYFIDPIGTGYIIYGGGELEIMNQRQSCYIPEDTKMEVEQSGDFATLLINHGKEPQGASYEFCIIPAAEETQLKKISKRRCYEVLQQDDTAHIVEHNGVRYHTIFSRYKGASKDLVQSVENPSLLIIEPNSNKSLTLSVASPSYNTPEPIRVTLKGLWSVASECDYLESIEQKDGNTTISIENNDGLTTTITLSKL